MGSPTLTAISDERRPESPFQWANPGRQTALCRVREPADGPVWDDPAAMTLSRIAWLVTVGTCLIGAVLLFVAGYQGYGVLALFVGAAAAINVR